MAIIMNEEEKYYEGKSKPSYSKLVRNGTLVVLFLINVINYIDRYVLFGIVSSIQNEFQIGKAQIGLLQTVFIISYMIFSPLAGYFGDRYDRKIILALALTSWSIVVFWSSFIRGPENFWLFAITRALVGIGEAVCSCVAPTIISDLFDEETRTRAFSVFMMAPTIGGALGLMGGSKISQFAADNGLGGWEYALRLTPVLSIILLIPFLFFVPRNLPRGDQEISMGSQNSYKSDIKYLLKNQTWRMLTVSFILYAFSYGGLSVWLADYASSCAIARGDIKPCLNDSCQYSDIMTRAGIYLGSSGITGVILGLAISSWWKKRGNERAEAHVCALGLLLYSILFSVIFYISFDHLETAWHLAFFGFTSANLTWALMINMTIETSLPECRASAVGIQSFLGHALGDSFSPFLIGFIADKVAKNLSTYQNTYVRSFIGIRTAMYIVPATGFVAGIFFYRAGVTLLADKQKVLETQASDREIVKDTKI